MRHALLFVMVLGSLAGCATAAKREPTVSLGKATEPRQAATPQPACATFAMAVPTGVAHGDGAVLFIRAEGGVEAVDSATGATLWRSTNVDRVVAIGNEYVAGTSLSSEGERDALVFSLMDRKTGALLSNGPELSLAGTPARTAEVVGAFCSATELDVAWSGLNGSGRARVDLVRRVVVAGPSPGGGASVRWVDSATVQNLQLRVEEGVLRAFADDGGLRWERPLAPRPLSIRP